jgi:enoyl-CoA hydratase
VPLLWELDGDVGVATIDRPERRNALDADLCDAFLDRFDEAPDLRSVVITGAGDKAFCAGADLVVRTEDASEPGGGDTFRPAFDRLLDAIVDYPAPVLAAVNGPAIGAGMQLAVACDVRIAVFSATFSIPAARLGVFLSPANVQLLARSSARAARDLLLQRTSWRQPRHRARAATSPARSSLSWREIAELTPLTVRPGAPSISSRGVRDRPRRMRDSRPAPSPARTSGKVSLRSPRNAPRVSKGVNAVGATGSVAPPAPARRVPRV